MVQHHIRCQAPPFLRSCSPPPLSPSLRKQPNTHTHTPHPRRPQTRSRRRRPRCRSPPRRRRRGGRRGRDRRGRAHARCRRLHARAKTQGSSAAKLSQAARQGERLAGSKPASNASTSQPMRWTDPRRPVPLHAGKLCQRQPSAARPTAGVGALASRRAVDVEGCGQVVHMLGAGHQVGLHLRYRWRYNGTSVHQYRAKRCQGCPPSNRPGCEPPHAAARRLVGSQHSAARRGAD